MKNLFVCFFLLSLLWSCNKSQFADFKRPDATGPILQILSTTYEAHEHYGKLKKDGISSILIEEYYKDGKIKTVKEFGEQGDIETISNYEYDSKGYLTQVIENKLYGKVDTLIVKEKGNKQLYYCHDTLSQTITRTGNMLITSDAKGNPTLEVTFDDRGRPQLNKVYGSNNSFEMEYDEIGLCKIKYAGIADEEMDGYEVSVSPKQFDEHGNYTLAILSFQGEVIGALEREITYWE